MRNKIVRAALPALCFLLLLTAPALADGSWETPEELRRLDPETAAAVEAAGETGLASVLGDVLRRALDGTRETLLGGARAVCRLMAGTVLLGAVESLFPGEKEKTARWTAAAGALWVTAACAGDMSALIGQGRETIGEIDLMSKGLLPVLAGAAAASGGVTAASARQSAAALFSDILITAIDRLLLPMVYLYIGCAAAGAVLEGETMDRIGDLIKKGIGWALGLLVGAFTAFLTVTGAVAGNADERLVKAAKASVSAAVPVVGSILADASESVLAAAGMLRSVAGAFGAAGLLALCAAPFLHLGVQYLLYQGAAVVASAAGPGKLGRLISRLGDAFALVLAMTASAAVMLLISIVSSLTAAAS